MLILIRDWLPNITATVSSDRGESPKDWGNGSTVRGWIVHG